MYFVTEDIIILHIIQKKTKPDKEKYDINIVNQLLAFEMGTKSEIMYAMDMVNNRNDINEIIDYLISHNNNNNNNNVPSSIKIIYFKNINNNYILYYIYR